MNFTIVLSAALVVLGFFFDPFGTVTCLGFVPFFIGGLVNRTVGAPITVRLPPQLEGFIVVGGTWKPADLTKNKEHMDETEQVFNVGFYAPGTRVTCELYQKVTDPPTPDLQVSQVIDEVATADNPTPGSWVVMKADPADFGTSGIKFSVELMRYDNMDLSQVTPA